MLPLLPILLQLILLRKPLPRPRVRAQQPLAPDEICHGLRDCDGGGMSVVSVQLLRTLRLVPTPAQAPALAPVSTGGATRPLARLGLGLELRSPRPAHYHRTSAARARVPWLLP
ncbi:MAG: hypothetical protein ABSA27_17515 [Terriglobales bacterium]